MSDPNEIPLGPEPTPPPPNAFPTSAPGPVVPAYAAAAPGQPYIGPAPTPDAKTMGMLAHLLNVTVLGPLLVYVLKKDEHPFIADQSREALNFSLSCLIVHVICGATAAFCVPALVAMGLVVTQIVLGVIGGLKARDGIAYRYPLTFRFIT